MKLYTIDNEYLDYLSRYDDKVPTEHGQQKRPYVGIVIQQGDVKYFTPLSSPKLKHLRMSNNMIDCIKLSEGRLGVVNLNNMIPAPEETLNEMILPSLEEIEVLPKERKNYMFLLRNQLEEINTEFVKEKIQRNAGVLLSPNFNNTRVLNRCLNWNELKAKSMQFEYKEEYEEKDDYDM